MDEEIAARLKRIERRLDRLEERLVRPPLPAFPPAPQLEAAPSSRNLEAALGAQWLPRVGAVAVIGAIATLVGLGLQRGAITPAMVAIGTAFVCAMVAVLGSRLRGEREAFGNVLVGLAAGGTFVDAVGAHLYHDLLNGEATVAACAAISLATVAFGARRGLSSMLGAGLFGGLLAALMPLSKGAVATSAGLLVLVSAPAFAVSGARRWPTAAAACWSATALAALAVLFSAGPLTVRLLPLDVALLMAVAAWTFATEELPAHDPQGAFPVVAACLTGLGSFAVLSGLGGVGHVVGLGAAVGAIGFFFRARETGRRVALAGLTLALVVASLGAHSFRVPALLASLSIVEAFALRRRIAPIVAAQAVLAVASYGFLLLAAGAVEGAGLVHPWEPWLIVLLALSAVAAALEIDRFPARVAAGVAVWGLATRLAVIELPLDPSAALTVSWIATFAALLALGFVRHRSELRQLGLFVAAATAAKVVLIDLSGLDAATKAIVLLVLGMVMLAGGYAYVRWVGRIGEDSAPNP